MVAGSVIAVPTSASATPNAAPTFTANTPPVFEFGLFYGDVVAASQFAATDYLFAAAGVPAPTFSVSSGALPTGLTLNPTTGRLSGTPTVPGQSYTYSVTASNGVAPDAVAGPYTGTVQPWNGASQDGCATLGGLAPNPGGSSVVTAVTAVTVTTVDAALPDATASATRVIGRVIANGTPTVVYDHQVPVASTDLSAQALFGAAAAADTTSAPTSTVAAPAVASTVTTTSPPVQVGQVFGDAIYQNTMSTATFGPAQVDVGANGECVFNVANGQKDVNFQYNFTQTVTDQTQATTTTTTTYYVDATLPATTPPVTAPPVTAPPVTVPPVSVSPAYLVASADGSVYGFAGATTFGSEAGHHLNAPVVGITQTPDGKGYWEFAADGGVFSFGDAGFFGSEPALPASARSASPVVGMAATPDGHGYWLATTTGQVFTFGTAGFYGSTTTKTFNAPVVGITATADGKGYLEVASDGGVFAFGDAGFYGSMGGQPLNQPVVGIATDTTTGGYWLAASDGAVFAFNAPFYGSASDLRLSKPISAIAATPDANGYRLAGRDGGIFDYGDALFAGSLPATTTLPPAPIISLTN